MQQNEKRLTYYEKLETVENEDKNDLVVMLWSQGWIVFALMHPVFTLFSIGFGLLGLVSASMSRDRHYNPGPIPYTIPAAIFIAGLVAGAVQKYVFVATGSYISIFKILFGTDF